MSVIAKLTDRVIDKLVRKAKADAGGCTTRQCPGRPGCYQTCCPHPCNNNCFC
ncbi:hypothetical protein HNR73_007857 [Phytomonospora endophytica]|uniref:Uncharacterized protein n=1 Tax=Phytomonospora endophytica TaxID=714109 RepID=A0A841G214_9ACTN|nr:hypothetical protein [Phytomonospora endophytica]GIG70971.1 hypothetical protein Pen01_72660 [Phytomonospora endophytica]